MLHGQKVMKLHILKLYSIYSTKFAKKLTSSSLINFRIGTLQNEFKRYSTKLSGN